MKTLMILINKEEAEAIRVRFPDAHIVRTVKNKSKRHRYYCEESRRVIRFIDVFRNGKNANNSKEGVRHTNKQKTRRIPS